MCTTRNLPGSTRCYHSKTSLFSHPDLEVVGAFAAYDRFLVERRVQRQRQPVIIVWLHLRHGLVCDNERPVDPEKAVGIEKLVEFIHFVIHYKLLSQVVFEKCQAIVNVEIGNFRRFDR